MWDRDVIESYRIRDRVRRASCSHSQLDRFELCPVLLVILLSASGLGLPHLQVEAYSADPDASDEDLSGLCLDMMSCLGQTYTLVYQFSPWTVVMSKLSEALNATPLTVTTELSSKSCLRREVRVVPERLSCSRLSTPF